MSTETPAEKSTKMSTNEKMGLAGSALSVLGAAILWGPGGVFLVFGLQLFAASALAYALGEK